MTGHPRIAVLGAGGWGRNHIRVWHELGALRLVADPDVRQLAPVREHYPDVATTADVQAAIRSEAVDAVVIASPAVEHGPSTLRALEAGKDVLVEKPMATDIVDAERMIALADERGRILQVGHVLEYHPASRELKRMVDSGELGKIRYLYSNRLNFGKIRTVENALWSFAPHDVSLLLRMVDAEPLEVGCDGGTYLSDDIPDVTLMRLVFPAGVRAHVHVSWLHPFKEHRFVIVGDKQMAVFDDMAPWSEKLTLYPHTVEWMGGNVPIARKAERVAVPVPEAEPLRLECEAFLAAVSTRTAPLTDASSGLKVLRVLKAGEESLGASGRMVAFGSAPPATFVHPSAVVDPGAEIGPGTRVWHFTHVSTGAQIGDGCVLGQNVFVGPNVTVGTGVKIQNNVSVYEGVELGDHVFCGPSAVFTNVANPRSEVNRKHEFLPTKVGRGATIGANSTIVCGTTLGDYAFVAAGAVVTRDVPAHGLVVGVPAQLAGWMCACGVRLPEDDDELGCPNCSRRYTKSGSTGIELRA